MWLLFSLLTSSTLAQDISSCCTRVSLSSSGDASNHQTNRLGVYQLTGILNDRPKYTIIEGNGVEHLFYLQSRNRGLWMVGPEAGQFNGGLAHRGDALCVEDVKPGQWKYTDGRSWNLDQDILVTCLDDNVTDPACEYSDQTEFQGGDLPEIFGGGGVETSSRTSAECITLCEQTAGCHYWTYIQDEKINCFLKRNKGESVRRPKYVSGSDPAACSVTPPITTTTPKIAEIADNDIDEPVYNQNEINAKFKIMMAWDEKFNDPESEEYQSLANSIENDLEDMLRQERDLSEQVESFTVKVQKLRRGSVVCDFKVNYILKEAYIAIPFAIKPANITDAMNNNFKFKKGILFQRFLIAGGSFNASSPVDHCAAKGCSHKCNYDYEVEDYICTCPKDLILASDGLNCVSEYEEVTELYDKPKEETSTKSEIESSTKLEVETSTKSEIELTLLPTDCMWSPWSQWGQCTVTSGDCGTGVSTRTRSVVIPAKNGGQCDGETEEREECQVPCDGVTTVAPSGTKSTPEIIVASDFEDVTTSAEQDDTTTASEDVATNDNVGRSDLDGVVDEDNQSTTVKTDEDTTVASGDEVNVVFPEEVIEPVVEQTTDAAMEEVKQETTTGSNVETETSAAMIDDDDAFGKKLDEATTENMIAQSTMPINEDGSTDQIETETTANIDDTVAETTTDAKIVYPLPVTEDDTTATIVVDEEELNPVTESAVNDVIETTTMKIIEGEITTEAHAEGRAEEDVITTEETETMKEVVNEDMDEDATTPKDELTTAAEDKTDVEMRTTGKEDAEVSAVEATTETKNVPDESVDELTTVVADTKDISMDAGTTASTMEDVAMDAGTTVSTMEEDVAMDEQTTISSMEDGSETTEDMTTVASVVAEDTSELEESEATTDAKQPRLDISMETTPVSDVEETTVVVVEVTADTTEDNIDSLSLVTEPAVDVTEAANEQEEFEASTDSETDLTLTEVSTEPEVETETTESSIVDAEEEVSTQTELIEASTDAKIDEAMDSTEPGVDEEISSTESQVEDTKVSTEPAVIELTTESVETETEPADSTDADVMDDATEDMMLATERSIEIEDASVGEEVESTTEKVDEEAMIVVTSEEVSTEAPTVTVTATSISDKEDDTTVTLVTTMKPVHDDTTIQPITDNDTELLCTQSADMIDNNVPMKCKHIQGDQERTVLLIIPAETLGEVSLDRLFDKNVKIIVKDFMIMDRSPRLL